MIMDINEQEIWLRAYTAALTGRLATGAGVIGSGCADDYARAAAVQAVEDFAKRFPAFRFHSEETKK
jgi:hypothetical protein